MARTLVLVVGDEPTFVDAVKLILEDHGFEAVGASSTSDYLDSANGWRFDLTIADVRSDTSGFEILTRLRQQ